MQRVIIESGQQAHRGTAKRRRRWRRRFFLLLVLIAVVVAAVYGGMLARDVWSEAQAGRTALSQGLNTLEPSQISDVTAARLAEAQTDFKQAGVDFSEARDKVGFWGNAATDHGGFLPGPARQAQTVAPLLDLGRSAAIMGNTLCQALKPLVGMLQGSAGAGGSDAATSPGTLQRLSSSLEQSQALFSRAQAELADARARRRRLASLPPVSGSASLLATFDRNADRLASALSYAKALPAMLGSRRSQAYLFLFQDPADLRATGGFVGSAGLISVKQGHISEKYYEIGPDFALPEDKYVRPPEPLAYYMGASHFQIWDANFWPDFPTSARGIESMYRKLTGTSLDGVVAVNPPAVSQLLQALGPITIQDYHETLTAANAVDRIEYYVHTGPEAQRNPHRKQFIFEVATALIDRLTSLPGNRLASVLRSLQSALDDRSLMVSVNDPVFASGLQQAHWDGALRTGPGDYLAVFDQNVTDSKLNPNIDEAVTYDATIRPNGSLDSHVTVAYHNRTVQPSLLIPRPYYKDFMRIATPGDSMLQSQDGYDDTFWPDELSHGRHLITGGFVVPANSTRTVSVSYTQPAGTVKQGAMYRLLVQKQSGSPPSLLSVRIHDGKSTWTASTLLTHDTELSTALNAPSGPLQVIDASIQ